jgi:Kef-type K+ transport system membrane component KefB
MPPAVAAGAGTVGFLDLESPHGSDWLFLAVFAAIVLGPLVAARVRLPGIVGLLAGGLVIGPQALGIVTATDTTVSGLGQVGLLYLMFTAGLELDLALFNHYRRAAVIFGVVTFAVPLALGFVAGRMLSYSPEAALLLGSIWASHTLVTYPVVRSAGLAGNRAVATTVSATVLTDTLALIVLAAVSGSETGDSATSVVVVSLLLGLGLLVVYCVFALPRVTRWFFSGPAQDRPMRYAYLLVAMLSAAVLAEVVGIEGIVGAFFAGLGLNRLVPAGSALMERIEFFGSALFVPVFLVSVGILINPSVMVRPGTLGLAAVFSLVVIGGKALAALLARPLLGFSGGESGLMFGLSVSQAAATLAATFVGFDIGLFGEQVVNAVLVVILVTLILAAVTTERFTHYVEPTPLDVLAIGQRVIVPIGHANRLETLARLSRDVATPDAGVVTPLRLGDAAGNSIEADRELLAATEAAFASAGLDAEAHLRVAGDACEAVVSTALEEQSTLVILDWYATVPYQPALRGSRDDQFVGASPVPVVLAAMSTVPYQRVFLALDRHCVDATADPDELALAVTLARRLSESTEALAAVAVDAADEVKAGIAGLPQSLSDELSDLLADEPVEGDAADPGHAGGNPHSLPAGSRPGDLVVLPARRDWEAFGPTALRLYARPGVSVVVVADPARWAVTAHGQSDLGVFVGRHSTASVRWR